MEAKALILAMVDKSHRVGFCYLLLILLYTQSLLIWSLSMPVVAMAISRLCSKSPSKRSDI